MTSPDSLFPHLDYTIGEKDSRGRICRTVIVGREKSSMRDWPPRTSGLQV